MTERDDQRGKRDRRDESERDDTVFDADVRDTGVRGDEVRGDEVRGAGVRDIEDDPSSQAGPSARDRAGYADREYGFSGRDGFSEGNYSSAYGRGTGDERDAPSASGYGGAGYRRGGTDIPRPDQEPPDAVRIDDEDEDPDAAAD